jgi:hypothetical protein
MTPKELKHTSRRKPVCFHMKLEVAEKLRQLAAKERRSQGNIIECLVLNASRTQEVKP